jgi:hypothetical protein
MLLYDSFIRMVCAIGTERCLFLLRSNAAFALSFEESINKWASSVWIVLLAKDFHKRINAIKLLHYCYLNCLPKRQKQSFWHLWNKDILVSLSRILQTFNLEAKISDFCKFRSQRRSLRSAWVLTEALSMNTMVQTMHHHRIDFPSVYHAELRHYILYHIYFHHPNFTFPAKYYCQIFTVSNRPYGRW